MGGTRKYLIITYSVSENNHFWKSNNLFLKAKKYIKDTCVLCRPDIITCTVYYTVCIIHCIYLYYIIKCLSYTCIYIMYMCKPMYMYICEFTFFVYFRQAPWTREHCESRNWSKKLSKFLIMLVNNNNLCEYVIQEQW